MDKSDQGHGDQAQPPWGELSAERRAEYINRDVKGIIEKSRAATRQIVAEAVEAFKEDYGAIKSKSLRVSVIRNISGDPLRDPYEPEDRIGANPGQLAPPPRNQPSQMGRSRGMSFFLRCLRLGG